MLSATNASLAPRPIATTLATKTGESSAGGERHRVRGTKVPLENVGRWFQTTLRPYELAATSLDGREIRQRNRHARVVVAVAVALNLQPPLRRRLKASMQTLQRLAQTSVCAATHPRLGPRSPPHAVHPH